MSRVSLKLLGLLLISSAANADTGMNKDIDLLEGALQASIAGIDKTVHIGAHNLDSLYLPKQGVVYTLSNPYAHLINGALHFNFDFNVGSDAPVISAEDVVGHMEEEQRHYWEMQSRMHQERLEFQMEMKEYERELKDMTFELESAKGKNRDEIEKHLEELQAAVEEGKKAMEQAEREFQKAQKQQNSQMQQRNQQVQLRMQSFVKAFEGEVAYTLCRFGAALKSLPDDQYISFVLKGMGAEVAHTEPRDNLVYVFRKEDVLKCVIGQLNEESLLEGAAKAR
ncbi:hypothetical protein [Gilvimarinus gilvus]|nr:hypothetical protein [Gilvimarinus sp. SDUM040013]